MTIPSPYKSFPIKRPGLRARLLNRLLMRYVKAPAQRQPADFELREEHLRRGAQRAAKMLRRNERLPADVTLEKISLPTPAGGMEAEWLSTAGAASDNPILYLHGGGYFMCSPASHRPLTAGLAKEANRRVLSINYRQGPDHAFPAWLEDAVSAYRYLLEQGYAANKMVIGGDSAGGNLVLSCLQQLRNEGLPLPAAAFCISPWADLAGESASVDTNEAHDVMLARNSLRSLGRYHLRGQDAADPLLSPVHADFSGFPPLMIQVGSTEILRDDSYSVAERASEAGVEVRLEEWRDLPHVFHLFSRYIPEGRRAIRHLTAFISERA